MDHHAILENLQLHGTHGSISGWEDTTQGYTLQERLGRGASGEVWGAVHDRLGLLAAIKRVRGGDLAEARVIAGLDHPNVVRIYDAGLDESGAWIAMERAAGTLGSSADRDGWVAALDAVLAGLAAAHAAGVVHGDVKPGNVLVRPDGTPVVSDFGLVATGSAGTPAYLAPEVFAGRSPSPRSDLYGVGCLGVTLCTGSPPFGRGDWAALSRRHQTEPVVIEPRIPLTSELVGWLQTLLAKDPGARFQHAADARHALRQAARVRAVVVGTGAAGELTVTRTRPAPATTEGVPSLVTASDAPPVAPLPRSWPRRAAPREPGQAGTGLLGMLELPFAERLELQDRLWGWLREVEQTREPLVVRLDGPPGSGRTRLGRALQRAAGESGAAVPGVAGDRVRVEWLDELEPEPTRGPVLQVTTAPVEADHVLTLPPFRDDLCRRVLARWVHLRRDQVSDLADRCAGDLGLAVQTVTEAVEAGVLVPGPDGLEATGSLPLAPTVVAGFRARLEALDPSLREAVAGCTVLGPVAERARLEALVDDPAAVQEVLVGAGLAHPTETGFRWVSTAALEAARPEDDRAWHGRVADLVQGEDWRAKWERGTHRLYAGDALGAANDVLDSSRDVIGSGKMVQAERVLRRLYDELEALEEVDHLLRCDVLHALGQLGPTHLGVEACLAFEDASRAIVDAHADHPDWQRKGSSVYGSYAWILNVLRLTDRCAPVVARAMELEGGDHHPATLCELGYVRMGQGRPVEAEAALKWATERAIATKNQYSELIAQAILGEAIRMTGRPREAVAHFLAVRERLWEAGYHSADGDLLRAIGEAHRFAGDLEAALEAYRGAVSVAAEGEARADPSFELSLAIGLGEAGELDEAHARIVAVTPELREMGPTWTALAALARITVESERGDPADVAGLRAVREGLAQTGYHDPDVRRAAERILRSSLDDGLLEEARKLLGWWPGSG